MIAINAIFTACGLYGMYAAIDNKSGPELIASTVGSLVFLMNLIYIYTNGDPSKGEKKGWLALFFERKRLEELAKIKDLNK